MDDNPKCHVARLDDMPFRKQARSDDDFAAVRDDPRLEEALR
jgi:hypothetical protein